MGYGIDRGIGYHGSPHQSIVSDVAEEMVRAREKFPGNYHLLAALTEEVGELAKALLQKGNSREALKEAIQVASTAMRIAEEGDGAFPNNMPHGYKTFQPDNSGSTREGLYIPEEDREANEH